MQPTPDAHDDAHKRKLPQMTLLTWSMLIVGAFCLLYSFCVEPVSITLPPNALFEPYQGFVARLPGVLIVTGVALVVGAGVLAFLPASGWAGLAVLLLIGLVIRLAFAFGFFGTADMRFYLKWARYIGQQGLWNNLYTHIARIAWGPLPVFMMGFFGWVADLTGIPLYGLVALPPILSDLGIGFMVYLIAEREHLSPQKKLAASALYLLSPISILVSAYHPQFGAVYILPAIIAYYLFAYRDRYRWAGLILGFGISMVIFPVLFIPAFLAKLGTWRKRIVFLIMAGIMPALFFAPYLLTDFTSVYQKVFRYNSEFGTWGSSFLLRLFVDHVWAGPGEGFVGYALAYGGHGLLLVLAIVGLVIFPHMKLHNALTLTVLISYMNPTGYSNQYIILLLPFVVLEFENKTAIWYTVLGSVYGLTAYMGNYYYPEFILNLYPVWPRPSYLLSLPVWAFCGWELCRRLWPYLRNLFHNGRPAHEQARVGEA
jgi:hypothetical protein